MNKLVTLASVGVFLLSLQGASLAQDKTPATPASPAVPPVAAPAVTGPVETPATPEVTGAQKTKKTKKTKVTKEQKAVRKEAENLFKMFRAGEKLTTDDILLLQRSKLI